MGECVERGLVEGTDERASFLKERLKQEFNLKFPQLLIRGESGAGKTETVEGGGNKWQEERN